MTGATCNKDIRTYKNIIYETFQKACIAHGILGDDNEWNLWLKEAAEIQTRSKLRDIPYLH